MFGWLWVLATLVAYLVVAAIALGLLILLVWGLHRLSATARRPGPPARAAHEAARTRRPGTPATTDVTPAAT